MSDTNQQQPSPILTGQQPNAAPGADARAWLPEAYRSDPTFQDLKDIDGLAKSYKSAAQMIGMDRSQLLKLPKEENSAEWEDFYAAVGRPKDPDGYQLKGPEGLPPETLSEFAKTVHAAGLSGKQANAIMEWYGNKVADIQTETATRQQREGEVAYKALQTEWGAAYADRLHDANRAIDEVGGKPLLETLKSAGLLGNVEVIRFFAKVGAMSSEPSSLRGGGAGRGSGAITPDAAQKEIRRLQGDREFFNKLNDRTNPAYRQAKQQWDELHSFAYPNS